MRRVHRISPGHVDVWIVTLGNTSAVQEDVLTRAEDRVRYAQIIPSDKKRNFAFRRATLDLVLKHYLDEYTLTRCANGKPYVKTDGGMQLIHFNASTSSDICAIGLATEKIGIDVESRNSKVDLVGVCERFLPNFSSEKKNWPKTPLVRQVAMSAWCRIESLIKLRGHTLHAVLTGDDKSVSDWIQEYGCSDVVISGCDYVCAVSQEHHFDISNIYTIEYEQMCHGYH